MTPDNAQSTLSAPGDGPPLSESVATVISCGSAKQDLSDGETVPAHSLYTSTVHSCKEKFALHSDGYYIASAKYGLISADTELPWYDKTLTNMSDSEVTQWASDVSDELRRIVEANSYDAVVIIGGRDYVMPLKPLFHTIPADILTPWQTNDEVTGIGKGMKWCNTPSNWPANVDRVADIGEVVSPK